MTKTLHSPESKNKIPFRWLRRAGALFCAPQSPLVFFVLTQSDRNITWVKLFAARNQTVNPTGQGRGLYDRPENTCSAFTVGFPSGGMKR
jgi:hypothetical protein